MGQHRANIGQHQPNIGPTWAQDGPNIAQLGPTWLNMGPTWRNISPSWAQDGSTWARLGPTCAQPALNIRPDCIQARTFGGSTKGQPQPNSFVLAPSKPSWTKGTRPRTMELEGITMLILHLKSYIEYVLCVRVCANKDLQHIRRQYHVSVGTAISRDSCRKRTAEDLKQEAIDNVVTPSLPQPAIRPTKNG